MRSPRGLAAISLCTVLVALGCGGKDTESSGNSQPKVCTAGTATGCATGQVCEEVQGKDPACFAPLSLTGKVINAIDQKPIEGAHVVARDADDAAVSSVAVSAKDGTYKLAVPAARDATGKPISANITLRADATGFETFPEPPRVALPIDLAGATGTPPTLASAETDIALLPLPNATGLGSISGKVIADHPGGTLVVAGGSTGIADTGGVYTVFNVTAGTGIEVRAYDVGVEIPPVKANVVAGKETPNVDLKGTGAATASVTGKVDIVNGGGASVTSVVLAVEETFNVDAARGEVPKGLKAENVTGDFTIKDVPDGKYVVLAAFENDGLVRDPDTSIAGTDIVHITVAGASQTLSTSFKVTGALAVMSPGASKIDVVSGTPSFVWADDSSEDLYWVQVFDAFGKNVWEDKMVPSVKGSASVTAKYAGPALQSGMIYQFRATSLKMGVPISRTEDLKGVFSYK